MLKSPNFLSTSAVLALTSSLCYGQIPGVTALSPSAGLAAGISLTTPVGSSAPDLLLVCPPRTSTPPVAPIPFSNTVYPVGPDYSHAFMFGALAPDTQIDAHCSGNSQLPPLDLFGVPNLVGRWASITVSTSNDAVGADGSITRQRRSAPGRTTPGADLLTYFLAGSSGLAPGLAGMTFLSRASEDLGLGGAGSVAELDALDLTIGVRAEARSTRNSIVFPATNDYYYSLTETSADDLNGSTSGLYAFDLVLGILVPADPCTIYRMSLNSANNWEGPYVYVPADDLGLDPEVDNLDALSLDRTREIVVYSTQIVFGRSQLMIYGPLPSGGMVNQGFVDASGQLVTTQLGLRDNVFAAATERDDVRTACIVEPESSIIDPYFAIPRELIAGPGYAPPMMVSASRYRPLGAAADRLLLSIAGGLPASGGMPGSMAGFTATFFAFDYDRNVPSNNIWELANVVPRYWGEDFLVNDAVTLQNDHGAMGFTAVTLDLAGNVMSMGYASELRVPQ